MKKNWKAFSLLLALLMLAASLFGCTQPAMTSEPTQEPVAAVEPTAAPEPTEEPRAEQRIVCLAPSMVEVVYALGLGEEIVGWSAYTDYPPEVEQREGWVPYVEYYYTEVADFDVEAELAKDVAVVSKFYDCNYEIIEALEPTIIFGEGTAQQTMVDDLIAKGVCGV